MENQRKNLMLMNRKKNFFNIFPTDFNFNSKNNQNQNTVQWSYL